MLRNHVTNTPSSLVTVSLMLSTRLKSANHNPNELNRSSSDLVDATNSHASGIRK